jgi:hypothetical protein
MRLTMRHPLAWILLSATTSSAAVPASLPQTEEIDVALEAAPDHLRAGAGVYVLEAGGYRLARASRNGFHCLIEREMPTAFEPKCFDAEGSDTVLPVILFRAEQRARGVVEGEIDRAVTARFDRGEFVSPRGVGICYMLSTRNVVVTDRASHAVARVGPRLMFYAPYIRNADLGAAPAMDSRVMVTQEGSQSAMIVVPVVSAERIRTYYLSPDGLTPLTRSPAVADADAPRRESLHDSVRASCAAKGRRRCRIEPPPPVNPMP